MQNDRLVRQLFRLRHWEGSTHRRPCTYNPWVSAQHRLYAQRILLLGRKGGVVELNIR